MPRAIPLNPPNPIIFDRELVERIVRETGLSLKTSRRMHGLCKRLNETTAHYYWNDLQPNLKSEESPAIPWDAIADASVSPHQLLDRLKKIETAARQFLHGTSRRPQTEKAEILLASLGHARDGTPLKYSGTEAPGHGGSERAAIGLCLTRAIANLERPPRGYRPPLRGPSWRSKRKDAARDALVQFLSSPDRGREKARRAAQDYAKWVRWWIPKIHKALTGHQKRHTGDVALNTAIRELATVYEWAFSVRPSAYEAGPLSKSPGSVPWGQFLYAVLGAILHPDPAPDSDKLVYIWTNSLKNN
ncbi:MAG: hypothetical protein RLQ25_10860 [Alphaproteobacteria bacterium]|uniref:hypothetical protein n=1 Tax=Marinobacter salarius TaxID=1420917 RepID=UPI0032ECA284